MLTYKGKQVYDIFKGDIFRVIRTRHGKPSSEASEVEYTCLDSMQSNNGFFKAKDDSGIGPYNFNTVEDDLEIISRANPKNERLAKNRPMKLMIRESTYRFIKDPSSKESKSRLRKRSIKEANEVGYGEYDEFKSEITDELESWGFEYSDDCHWDYFMPFGFYATYNARDGWAAILWDNDGIITEIKKYSVNRLDTPEKADKFGEKCYNFSNYGMDNLLIEGLIINGAVETEEDPLVFEYTDIAGDFWVIDLRNDEADVTYSNDGSTEHFEGMWDILSACGLIP